MASLAAPVLLLAVSSASGQTKSYRAERIDLTVSVQRDGSLQIEETITFAFSGGPFRQVYRDIPVTRTDGITVTQVLLDGEPLPEGRRSGHHTVRDRKPVRVIWHLETTADATAAFTVRAQADGALERTPEGYLLRWHLLPTQRDYHVDRLTAAVLVPPGSKLREQLRVEGADARLTAGEGHVVITADDLDPDQFLILEALFDPRAFPAGVPIWQQRIEKWRSARDSSLGLGLLAFLAVSAAFLAAAHRRRARLATSQAEAFPTLTAPDDLPPTAVGLLSAPILGLQWHHVFGGLLALVQRGLLTLSVTPAANRWSSPTFSLRLNRRADDLRPHQQGILDTLFPGANHEVGGAEIAKLWPKGSSRVQKLLRSELMDARLWSEDLERAGRALTIRSGLTAGLGLLVLLAGLLLIDGAAQPGAVFVGIGLFASAVVGLIASATVSPVTESGLAAAVRWKGFARGLRQAAKGQISAPSQNQLEQTLPYAVSLGLASVWGAVLKRTGLENTPAWLELPAGLEAGADAVLAAAILPAILSSGSTVGSPAMGAGGAGGGASGAR